MSTEILKITKIHGHCRTQIPKEVAEKLGIKDGDKLKWILNSSGKIYVERVETPFTQSGPRYGRR
ncbi:hypothetical protein GH146_02815 [archaeon]|jgi:AbrB family looped-hinge helix DNA binding protein|nr:hypothetical protein [archaeon]